MRDSIYMSLRASAKQSHKGKESRMRRLLRRGAFGATPRNDMELMVGILQLMIRFQQADENLVCKRMHLVKHILPGFS